jgi:hypothetical protein
MVILVVTRTGDREPSSMRATAANTIEPCSPHERFIVLLRPVVTGGPGSHGRLYPQPGSALDRLALRPDEGLVVLRFLFELRRACPGPALHAEAWPVLRGPAAFHLERAVLRFGTLFHDGIVGTPDCGAMVILAVLSMWSSS